MQALTNKNTKRAKKKALRTARDALWMLDSFVDYTATQTPAPEPQPDPPQFADVVHVDPSGCVPPSPWLLLPSDSPADKRPPLSVMAHHRNPLLQSDVSVPGGGTPVLTPLWGSPYVQSTKKKKRRFAASLSPSQAGRSPQAKKLSRVAESGALHACKGRSPL